MKIKYYIYSSIGLLLLNALLSISTLLYMNPMTSRYSVNIERLIESSLSKKQTDSTINKIVDNYNQKDYVSIHSMFGDKAKTSISISSVSSLLENMYSLTGVITKSQYAQRLRDDKNNVEIRYIIETENGKTYLCLKYIKNDNFEYELCGIYIGNV